MTAMAPRQAKANDASAALQAPSPASFQARLETLCAAGAERVAPVAVRTVRVLASRIAQQPASVRRLLQEKAEHALQEIERRLREAPVPMAAPQRQAARAPKAEPTPLANLTQALRVSATRGNTTAASTIATRDELPSVERFRRAWTSARAQEQVAQGALRIPANAGPLNSHALVLQTLSLMQDLSPEYLAHFLRQVESLQWLEQVQAARTIASAKSATAVKNARRSASKKK